MKKKNEEEIIEKECNCGCGEECTCEGDCHCDNCSCDDECSCDCGCNCSCDDDCDCLEPLEEKLILIGKKSNKETKEAIKKLDSKNVVYAFIDLETEEDERFLNLKEDIQIPSLLLVQTLVVGVASGLDEIKDIIKK